MTTVKTYGLWFGPNDNYPNGHWFAPKTIVYATPSREAAAATMEYYFRGSSGDHRPVVKAFDN